MKKLIAGVLLWSVIIGSLQASPIDNQCPQFTAYGAPQGNFASDTQQLCKKNYAVIHSCSTKTPVAVMELVTLDGISGKVKRQDDFREDPEVHEQCRSLVTDYLSNGFDRGHMSAAGNNTQTAEIMSESFLLSNMVPQVANNNRGIWRALESQVRNQVRLSKQPLYVISGAIFDQGHGKIGNGVAVPTRLFKIIINKKTGKITAFLMPNAALPVEDLPKYKTTLDAVEQASGLKFSTK